MIRALALSMLLAVPAAAQENETTREGVNLMARAFGLILQGVAEDIAEAPPEGMPAPMAELATLGARLFGLIDEVGNYGEPRLLENGDILIPRLQRATDL
ncbi:hypothetical protein BCF33_0006 [Hasllibacter halocynthiae]|uniref:Uncharacterized protein n=1 Tax=Hasllibacter halocynthiae TaxID=595589 RepID=A0A2T0X659_9RHOB|nr:hypothetical protein [Hasllibacter halocynthiae]PRY94419.1 hypothetical protein BCF33_0006 [Hasllibacter halocynthiae]